MTTRRMEILKNSLEKKEAEFNAALAAHFEDVKSANGQPLNDKRNGHLTLNRWDRQNDNLRKKQESIEKTKRAIEREQAKIDKVESAEYPDFLNQFLESGQITQWRKYPNRFFVKGGGRARIIWLEKEKEFSYSHKSATTKEEWEIFWGVAQKIFDLNKEIHGK